MNDDAHRAHTAGDVAHHEWWQTRHDQRPSSTPISHSQVWYFSWIKWPSSKMLARRHHGAWSPSSGVLRIRYRLWRGHQSGLHISEAWRWAVSRPTLPPSLIATT